MNPLEFMDKEELKKIIISQNKILQENYIEREKYSLLKKNLNNDLIIFISGLRRAGKTTLLNQLRKENNQNKYFLNFDDDRLINFKLEDFENLYEAFLELFEEENIYYFDEIQNIPGWERFVRRLHNEGKKVIITGSNANLLSKELGTHLTGRHIEFELYPFSFKEFLKFKDFNLNKNVFYDVKEVIKIKRLFGEYLKNGGIPEFLKNKNETYLKTLYDNILYRDVMNRYKLSNEKTLKELIFFLISNIGSKVSYTGLKKVLGVANAITIKEYINYFENSFMIFQLNKFDYSLKKQIVNQKKIYVIDNGFASNISFKFSEDKGRLLENLVFLELKRKEKEIYYHYDNKECDFILLNKGKITHAIQVTDNLNNEKTRIREIEGLIDAMKTYKLKEGLILTDDESNEFVQEGFKITVKPIWRWLLENE